MNQKLTETLDYQTLLSKRTTFAEDAVMDLNHRLAMQLQLEEADEDAYSSENSSDYKDKVEYASDSPGGESGDETSMLKRNKKSKLDQEVTEADIERMELEEQDDDVVMDELENESLSLNSDEKRRKKEM
jgi:hypothetical protein